MANPTDLGKLQDAMRAADARVKAAHRLKQNSKAALERAHNKYGIDVKKYAEAIDELDKARQAMLDGARSVAQG
jgi:hypothetical protein